MASRTDSLRRARNLLKDFGGNGKTGMSGLIMSVIGSFMVAVAYQGQRLLDAIVSVIADPLGSLAAGVGGILGALFSGGQVLFERGAQFSGQSLEQFGVLAFVVGVGVFLLVLFLIAQYLQERETSDLLPGTFTDVPLIGTNEEGETDEE